MIRRPRQENAAAFGVSGCSNIWPRMPAKPMFLPVFWAIYLFLPIEKFRVNFDLRHARMRASQTYP
jgi:hypothetical protein